jgi:hypothetical protein
MGYQNTLLLRESISDTGDVRYHGSYYSSPDIISHALVNDPQKEFGGNYGTDPNQPINTNLKTNPVYVRTKSLQTAAGAVNGYVRLYRASGSLFLNSDQWSKNPLSTPKGSAYVAVSAQSAGQISVGSDCFSLDGTQENYCIVGIANDSVSENVPTKFKSLNDFVVWVHTNPGVAARNFSLIASGTKNDWESLYFIGNPGDNPVLGAVSADAAGLPDGTVFGLENTDLRLSNSGVYYAKDEYSHTVACSSMWPAHYDGYVRAYAKLPAGTVWPTNASISVTYYVAARLNEKMAAYGRDPEEVVRIRSVREAFTAPGKLVLIGECTAKFV